MKRHKGQISVYRCFSHWRKSVILCPEKYCQGDAFFSPQDLTGSELYTQAASLLHPVVYTTAVILLLCLLAVIVSYMYHHR